MWKRIIVTLARSNVSENHLQRSSICSILGQENNARRTLWSAKQRTLFHTLQHYEHNASNKLLGHNILKATSSPCVANARNVSNYFFTLEKPIEPSKVTRYNQDERYERVRKQHFGPVPVEESDKRNDFFGLSTREFAKRDHLTFDDGLKYHQLPIVFISARYNNTMIHIADHKHEVVYAVETVGKCGFKNAKKKTPYAAEMVGKQAAERAMLKGCPKNVRVKVKGAGYGRAAAVRGLTMGGMQIASVSDVTPLHVDGLPQRPRAIRRI